MSTTFKKCAEDFICNNCSHKNIGTGFTNHCNNCLHSKHVDINPGDRLEACGGLMKPKLLFINGDMTSLIHKCNSCGIERANKTSKNDNEDKLILLSNIHAA